MPAHIRNFIVFSVVVGLAVAMIEINRWRRDDSLNGVWRLESNQTNGQAVRRERELWAFRNGKLTIVWDNDSLDTQISVDSSTKPNQLDTDILFARTGIFKIAGDTLHVVQVPTDLPRPTEFRTEWGDMRKVSVLRRVNVETSGSVAELHELLLSEFGPPTTYPDPMDFDKDAERFVDKLMGDIYDHEAEMSAKEEIVYHVVWLITEVNNGGFHQYFINSTGENAVETVAYLHKINAPETARLLRNGCALFPNERPSKDANKRAAQVEMFTLQQFDALHDFDEQFYSRREDLYLLLKKYWEGEP